MAGKHSSGNGYVKKLPSGNWRAQFMDGYRDDGKRNMVSITCRTKGEVLDKMRAYWLEKENPPPAEKPAEEKVEIGFSQWADTWYADHRSEVQPSTYANYQYTLARLKQQFGDSPLSEIKPLEINRFYDLMKEEKRSSSYITKAKSMLIQIFDAAAANDMVVRNPARLSKSIKTKQVDDDPEVTKREKDSFTEEEREILHSSAPDNVLGHSVLLMLGTGLRTQEVLALTADDIAPDGTTISITKAIKMVDGTPILGPPKSKRSVRTVPVPEDYREHAIYLRNHSGKPYIWTSRRSTGLYDVGEFRKKYYRMLQRLPAVRKLSPHCLRHTYVSTLEQMGVPMEQIARLAGHTKVAVTDGYLHLDMTTLSNAVSVLNKNNT